MAGLADMLVGSVMDTSKDVPDFSGNIQKGAELAKTIEGMKQGREQLEQKKQELQMQKANSVVDTMKIAASSKDKRLKDFLLKKVLPAKVNALGMGEYFTPQTLEMVQSSEDAQKKVLGLSLYLDDEVRAKRMTGAEAYAYAQQKLADPEELAMLDTDQLFDAQKFANSEEGKSARAVQMAQASLGKQQQAQQAAPDIEYDKKLAGIGAALMNEGGDDGLARQLNSLDSVIGDLESGKLEFGTRTKKATGGKGLSLYDEDAKAAVDKVIGSIKLKALLADPNPTEIQIKDALGRVIDPTLRNELNLDKLKALRKELVQKYKAKTQELKRRKIGGWAEDSSPKVMEWEGKKYKQVGDRWVEVK